MRFPQKPFLGAVQNHTQLLLFRNRFESSSPQLSIGMILPNDENDSIASPLQQLIFGNRADGWSHQ